MNHLEAKKGCVYKFLLIGLYTNKPTGDYCHLLCEDKREAIYKVLYIRNNKGRVVLKTSIGDSIVIDLFNFDRMFKIADSLEEYRKNYSEELPTKEVIVEKEKIKEVYKVTRVQKYNDTAIDRLYNWYCKKFKNEYV